MITQRNDHNENDDDDVDHNNNIDDNDHNNNYDNNNDNILLSSHLLLKMKNNIEVSNNANIIHNQMKCIKY